MVDMLLCCPWARPGLGVSRCPEAHGPFLVCSWLGTVTCSGLPEPLSDRSVGAVALGELGDARAPLLAGL